MLIKACTDYAELACKVGCAVAYIFFSRYVIKV